MSAIEWVKQHSKHKPNVRFVLYMLAQCIDEGNTCPSQKELAELTGLSKDTVRRALGELEKDGTITRARKGGKLAKGGSRDCYQLTATLPTASSTQLPAGSYQQGATSTQQPVKHENAAENANAVLLDNPESVVIKDKKHFARTRAGGVVPDKPKKPADKSGVSDSHYQRLFRGVALRSWNIDPEKPETKDMLDKSARKRIGAIASWLQQQDFTPERLQAFYSWYKQSYPALNPPREKGKFSAFVMEFVQAGGQVKGVPYSPTADLTNHISEAPKPRYVDPLIEQYRRDRENHETVDAKGFSERLRAVKAAEAEAEEKRIYDRHTV